MSENGSYDSGSYDTVSCDSGSYDTGSCDSGSYDSDTDAGDEVSETDPSENETETTENTESDDEVREDSDKTESDDEVREDSDKTESDDEVREDSDKTESDDEVREDSDKTESDDEVREDSNKTESDREAQEDSDTTEETENSEDRNAGLTPEDREQLAEETGWSDEVLDSLKSKDEAEVYRNAGLRETEINEKTCLIRDDIDLDQKDEFGDTNRERMAQGKSPIAPNGETVELHHIGQREDSPLAELKTSEHRRNGNDKILHDKTKDSEIDRNDFSKDRSAHWKARIQQDEKE